VTRKGAAEVSASSRTTSSDGIKHKPDTTFGNVKAYVLADKDQSFRRGNFSRVTCAALKE
jgi:hypothetical protein